MRLSVIKLHVQLVRGSTDPEQYFEFGDPGKGGWIDRDVREANFGYVIFRTGDKGNPLTGTVQMRLDIHKWIGGPNPDSNHAAN